MLKYVFLLCILNTVSPYSSGRNVDVPVRGRAFDLEKITGDGDLSKVIENYNGECQCSGYMCGCCQWITFKPFHLNDVVCANMTYLNKDYGVRVTMSIDGKIYVNMEVSARNPPPICEGIPDFMKYASICLRFYDMHIDNSSIFGCARLEFRLKLPIGNVTLGCFKIPLPNSKNLDVLREKENIIHNGLGNKIDSVSPQQGKKNSEMTKEEKIEFIRRLGLLGKTYTDNGLQNIVIGYA